MDNSALILISDIYYTIILSVLFLLTTFLTAKGPLTDNRYTNQWFKRINNRGWWVIIINMLILIVLALQYINSKNWDAFKDKELKKEQKNRNKLIQDGIELQTDYLFERLSLAFVNQGVKIDSLKKILSNIKKSKSITNLINEKDPFFLVSNKSLLFEENKLEVVFTSHNAPSANYEMTTTTLIKHSDSILELEKNEFLSKKVKVPANLPMQVYLISILDSTNINEVYVLFEGSYSNITGNKKYKVDMLFDYDFKEKVFAQILHKKRDSIYKLMIDIENRKNHLKIIK